MSDDKKIYCGFRKVPTNSRRGTMKECAEMGKIAYYGIKKIDSRTIELSQKKKNEAKNLEKQKIKLVGMKGELKKLNKNLESIKDKKEKKKLEKLIAEKKEKYENAVKDYKSKKLGKSKK